MPASILLPRVIPASSSGKKESLFRDREKSLWKFYEHGVTSSFLQSFLMCREQTRLAYVAGLGASQLSLALEFGTCVHWLLEQAYGGKIDGRDVTDPKDTLRWTQSLLGEYEKAWRKEHPRPPQNVVEQQERIYAMAECVLPNYFRRWAGDFTGKYGAFEPGTVRPKKWLSLEQTFDVPYTFPDGRKVRILGKRDGVFEDALGKLWVFDTKCLSVITEDDITATMPLMLQFMLYLWVTWKELGRVPAGFVMNVVRRPGQRMLAQDTFQTYLDRVRKDVCNERRYDHYFLRFQMELTKKEIVWWQDNQLVPMMQDVRDWWDGRSAHYMNPNSLITKYGRCQMFDALTAHDTSGLIRRPYAFSELGDV